MNDLFGNKYRIPSTRLKSWDYSSSGYYFVTICTYKKKAYFGEITNRMENLSPIGEIALKCWKEIPNHFPNVSLDEFVVMPNHIHGILIIKKHTVETQNFASLQVKKIKQQNIFGPQSKNLASIVRGFKIGVTIYARLHTNIYDIWQPLYYDHIIRTEKSYLEIKQYIQNNPRNWEEDENNPRYL